MLSAAKHLTADQGWEILRCAQDDSIGAPHAVRNNPLVCCRSPARSLVLAVVAVALQDDPLDLGRVVGAGQQVEVGLPDLALHQHRLA